MGDGATTTGDADADATGAGDAVTNTKENVPRRRETVVNYSLHAYSLTTPSPFNSRAAGDATAATRAGDDGPDDFLQQCVLN